MRRRRPEEEMPVGAGDAPIPYDRSGGGDPTMMMAGPPAGPPAGGGGGGMPPALLAAAAQGTPPTPQLGSDVLSLVPDSSGLSDEDLAALGGAEDGGDEDLEIQALEEILANPDQYPEEAALLQEQLALAARRRLGGLGGPGA